MGEIKNKYYAILPALTILFAILFQGLFTVLSAAICVIALTISLREKKITLVEGISLLFIFIGFFISDILNKEGSSFLNGFIKILLLIVPIFMTDEKQKAIMLKAVYWGINISSLIGVVAYISKTSFWHLTEYIGGKLHLQGVYGYSNVMAVICAVGIILALYYIKADKDKSFLYEITLGINILCICFTHSMLTVAALVIALIFGILVKYKKCRIIAYVVISVGIIALIVIIAFDNTDMIIGSTLACRLIYWYDAFGVSIKNPFGIGFDAWNNIQYPIQSAQYSIRYVHNGFLQLALDGGLVALGGITLIIINKVIHIVKKFRVTKDYKLIYILMAVIVVLIHSFVDIDMTYGMIWVILGVLLTFAPRYKLIFKSNAIISIALVIIVACTPFVDNIITDKLQTMNSKFGEAVNNNDIKTAYKVSKEMIEYAPKQQISYDAHYFVLAKQNNDEEIKELINIVQSVNKSMNPLNKFMSEHKEIILPIDGGVK